MPFVEPPVCFICGKVYPCDTENTLQLLAPMANRPHSDCGYRTVNCCKDHIGLREEYERQENLKGEAQIRQAQRALSQPDIVRAMFNTRMMILQKRTELLESDDVPEEIKAQIFESLVNGM